MENHKVWHMSDLQQIILGLFGVAFLWVALRSCMRNAPQIELIHEDQVLYKIEPIRMVTLEQLKQQVTDHHYPTPFIDEAKLISQLEYELGYKSTDERFRL